MNFNIFLICLALTGKAFTEQEVTDLPEKLAVTEPSSKEASPEPVSGGLKEAIEKKNPSGEEATPPTSGEKKEVGDKSIEKANPSEEPTPAGNNEELSEKKKSGAKLHDALDSLVTGAPNPPASGEETSEKSAKKGDLSKKGDNAEEPTPATSGEEVSEKPSKKEHAKLDSAEKNHPTEALPSGETDDSHKKMLTDSKIPVPDHSNSLKGLEIHDKKVENPPHAGDLPATVGYGKGKPMADHKMTATEQQAFVCSLPKCDLCPMTVDLDENVGIADPGANAHCSDLAATMGYKGFCVVLMKTDPETGDPIYTRTCAYYNPDPVDATKKSKCSTNFLTTQPQTNLTQVRYNCSNGISNYVPTSCVKRHKELVLP